MRTLVVDDSSSMRKLLTELLCERAHEVTAVASAEEALRAHARRGFQLMLVDWTLPGLSGLELCRRVRSQPGGGDVFILVVTGRNKAEDLTEVLDAGASDYLSKPVDPEILSTRLLIAERELEEAARRQAERREMESRLAFADRIFCLIGSFPHLMGPKWPRWSDSMRGRGLGSDDASVPAGALALDRRFRRSGGQPRGPGRPERSGQDHRHLSHPAAL